MPLMMDGLGRPGGAAAIKLPAISVAPPRPLPAPQRYVTGLDGIRRPVALSPAQQMLQRSYGDGFTPGEDSRRPVAATIAPEATPLSTAGPMVAGRLEQALGRPHPRAIAFGLVAGGLVVGGTLLAHNLQAASATQHSSAAPAAAASTQASETAASLVATTKAAQERTLNQILADFTAAHPGLYSLYVKDLQTGATSTINPDASMTAASLYKLFVAQQVYRQVDSGRLVYAQDAGGGSGRTLDACLKLMINISDNTCGRALGGILDWQKQDQALAADGYTATTLATPQKTSARDVGRLFEQLYAGTLASSTSNQRFAELLKDQKVNDRLPTGLPAGTVIAHKTGDLDGYMHNAGIIYGPKTTYLVVMMGAPGAKVADFTDLSAKLWSVFEN